MDTGKSALGGIDGNIAAAIGYPIGIIAIICLIMDKENRFVKFHALQSILLHVGFILVFILLMILGVIIGMMGMAASAASSAAGAGVGILGILLWLVWLVSFLVYIILLILAAVKAYGGNMFKLPIIGNMAEKFANK
jgi:uncharacterized membrane protein